MNELRKILLHPMQISEYFDFIFHSNNSIQNVPHFLCHYDGIYFYHSYFHIPSKKHVSFFSHHLGNEFKNTAKTSEL